jgi:hypothetical protein
VEAVAVLGGRYRLVERLGAGGMSVVWRAEDQVLRRAVAVKVLSPQHVADAAFRERIMAEARSAAGLSHPHVASVYDYGEAEDAAEQPVPYVVMELLNGRSLAQLLSDGPLPAAQGLRICAEVASALAAAHEQGIVHRDVKPANVMITPNGAKVVDFGIAAAVGEYAELDADAVMFGTPAYLAPERLDDGPVVPGTDVYAIGLLLYRTLTGALPWSVETTTQILRAHVYIEPQPLPRIEGLPASVSALYDRCLAKNPNARPSAEEVARVLADAAGTAVPPLGVPFGKDAGRVNVPGGIGQVTTENVRRSGTRIWQGAALVAAFAAVAVVAALTPRLFGAADRTPANDHAASAPRTIVPSAVPAAIPVDASPTGTSGTGTAAPNSTGAANGTGDRPDLIPPPPGGTGAGGGGPATTGPTGGATTTSADPTRTPEASPATRFDSDGGYVIAQCIDADVKLLAVEAQAGYLVRWVVRGPRTRAGARFKPTDSTSAIKNITIKVGCVGGTPDAKIVVNDTTPDDTPAP